MKYHVVLEKQQEGGYTAYIPELPGCISEGDSEEETMKNIEEAMELYLEELKSSNLKNPTTLVKVIEPSPG
ncbi:type II toxin-antitoxin system HicB family antitoxin [Candidatus Micrarchaeota archaeon]|nr:type II toxin-antitoxin system HicB family antitoxin [Candidatus Micrarchaeota archaeon]MBU1166161.1 type II toxin-antitoxin system HicB family antitoxin [Candidatus Micrarchaeota archaeon]MBU1886558.1 type II toxin-antitoxin system HicB family antitoxin [Candidatus Micrarchaeota archaeon]